MIIITSPPAFFRGELFVPGDKSITHRAIIIGSLANGNTEVRGFLAADDAHSTIQCLRALGTEITIREGRMWIRGRGMELNQPVGEINAGNSGTTARLLLGVLAGQSFETTMNGDLSLCRRPMKRVTDPLSQMGASFPGNQENLPLTIRGGQLKSIKIKIVHSSAQVKSAILLAGLYGDGLTVVEEPYISRNHTELMLAQFGADISSVDNRVSLQGKPFLRGTMVRVPGDISAAAFFMTAAAIIPESELLVKNVGINPTRSGIIDVLRMMGAEIDVLHKRMWGREPVANIRVRSGDTLNGITIEGALIPRLIDEIPVISVAASVARGRTIIKNASELRVKESDRIATLIGQLNRLGANIKETADGMIIEGGSELHGTAVESCGDHRLAMTLAIAGLVARGETAVLGAEVINISYPGFMSALRPLVTK